MIGQTMTRYGARAFLDRACRSEFYENKKCYMKAIRASLHALGYDPVWVDGEFRDLMEEVYLGEMSREGGDV